MEAAAALFASAGTGTAAAGASSSAIMASAMQGLNTGYAASVAGSAAAGAGGFSLSSFLNGASLFGTAGASLFGGLSQAGAMEGQAAWSRAQGEIERAHAAREDLNTTKRLQQLIAYNKAQAGASGLTVSSFTPVQDAIVKDAADELQTNRFNAQMKGYARQQETATLGKQASNTRKASLFSTFKTLAGGVGDYLERGTF